ncbi:hypothetical protein EYC84_008623 [Monilinia fructicola]|uniref:Uncharacterized protein n=1 Tax=Monilinia fructicola TaxID=38448 RepID=A0A5M9JIR1_MONFR|nr:hypothetical protein EYC84_008623 [Monilinia fructicola]
MLLVLMHYSHITFIGEKYFWEQRNSSLQPIKVTLILRRLSQYCEDFLDIESTSLLINQIIHNFIFESYSKSDNTQSIHFCTFDISDILCERFQASNLPKMFLQKLRSLSHSSNSKDTSDANNKHHRRRISLKTSNSEHKNPLSPSTTNSTNGSYTFHPRTTVCPDVKEISKENNGEDEDQEGRDFREYLEKCQKAEEAEERKKKKMRAMEKKRKEVNLSPWAGRM